MTSFPTITVWQPWGTLIAIGAKPFEFRGWAAPKRLHGQRVAIHAGARPVRKAELQELILRLRSSGAADTGLVPDLALPLLERALSAPGILPRSAIVCTAQLGEPIRGEELARRLGVAWTNDSDRLAHSNYGWPMLDVRQLTPPVPAGGQQGWWTCTLAEAA